MTKTRSTKSALISSVIALLLCFTMLLGTTFAWFTDSVTSANNVIKSGNLDIALDYWDGENSEWKTVEGTDSLFTNNLWEPGHTEVVYLKLSNLGSLALKYQLAINVLSETEGTNMAGDPFKLSDYIQMGIVEGVNGQTDSYTTREAAVDAVKANSGKIGVGYAKQGNMLADAAELYMAVVVYMPETVGNVANAMTGTPAPTINLGVQVLATQLTAESDGFDNTYDKDAWMPGMLVYDAADLKVALANGGNVTLAADVALTEIVEVAEGTTVALNLNGKTIKGSVDRTVSNGLIINNGSLTIYGDNSVIDNSVAYGGSVILNTGDLVLNGGTYIGGVSVPADGKYASYAINVNNGGTLTVNNANISGRGAIGVTNGATLVINDGLYEATTEGDSAHVIYVSQDGTAIINGGTFNHTRTNAGSNGDVLVYVNKADTSSAVINGGTFDAVKAAISYSTHNVTINGGTFKNAAATVYGGTLGNLIADGYKSVDNGDAYYVVPDTTVEADLYILNAERLVAFAAEVNGGNNYEGKTVALLNDIDLANVAWTPINGFKGTFNGNGKTISNMTVVADKYAGMFGYLENSGATITNLTIDGASVTANTVDTDGYAGAVLGYHYSSGGKVTVSDVTVTKSTITGKNGGAIAGSASVITVSGCVSEKNTINASRNGGIVGTTLEKSTVSGCTASDNIQNVQLFESESAAYVGTLVGRVSAQTTVEGNVIETITVTEAGTQAELNSAVSGNAIVSLSDGNYTMPGVSNKDVTISGTKETVIDVKTPNCGGSNVTLNGVTVKGNGTYTGIQHVDTVTYNNVTVEGEMCLYGNKVVFNNCTFNLAAEQYIWTYGATVVEFNNCTFNSQGKALLVYGDSPKDLSTTCTTYINNCKFNAETAVAGKAAIEIDSRFINQIVYIDELTTAEGFDKGNISGNDLWNNKKGNAAKVYVNNVEQTLNEVPNS